MKKTAVAVFCLLICLTLLPAFPVSASDTAVEDIVLNLPGATTEPFASENNLGSLQFSSTVYGTGTIETRWYENGLFVEGVYGNTAWKTKSLKANSVYYAVVVINAANGYKFTKNTHASISGFSGLCSVDYLSADGKTLAITTEKLYTECKHAYGELQHDSIGHWRKCKICAQSSETEAHNWISESTASGKTTYVCSVCGEKKTETTDNSKINAVYFDVGYTFIGETPTFAYLPVDGKIQAAYEMWTWGTTQTEQPDNCTQGFKYESGKYYRVTVAMAAANGYSFVSGTTKVYFRINGMFIEGKELSVSPTQSVWCIYLTPAEAPTVKIVLPDEIKAGDDLIKLSTGCRIFYNGKELENRRIYITVEGDANPTKCIDGVWSAGTDVESMIKKLFSGYNAVTQNFYRSLFTAQAGRSYSLCISDLYESEILVKATKAGNVTVEGAGGAFKVQYGENLSVSASYVVNEPYVSVVKLSDTEPKVGDTPVNVTSGKLRKTYSTSDKIACEKDFYITYTYYADTASEFEVAPLIEFNGKIVSYTMATNGQSLSFIRYYRLPHTEISETVPANCISVSTTTVKCKDCGKLISTTSGTAKNTNNHVGGTVYFNSDTHYEICQCGKTVNTAAHTYTQGGNTCSVCGYVKTSGGTTEVTTQSGMETGKPHETEAAGTTSEETSQITVEITTQQQTDVTTKAEPEITTEGVTELTTSTWNDDSSQPGSITIRSEGSSTGDANGETTGQSGNESEKNNTGLWISLACISLAVTAALVFVIKKKQR